MKCAPGLAVLLALTLAGCAAGGSRVERSAIPDTLHSLYDRAMVGDKHPQYALGLLLGSGAAGAPDCAAAREFLAIAARDEGGTPWVYSPPVGNGTQGRVITIDQGPRRAGHPQAKRLLSTFGSCPRSKP